MTANGRWARFYIAGPPGYGRFYLPVTYHRRARRIRRLTVMCPCGLAFTHDMTTRQLTVSPRLLARTLRKEA